MGLWAQTPEIEARWVGSKDLGLDLSRRGAEGRRDEVGLGRRAARWVGSKDLGLDLSRRGVEGTRDEVGLGRLTEVQGEVIKGNV